MLPMLITGAVGPLLIYKIERHWVDLHWTWCCLKSVPRLLLTLPMIYLTLLFTIHSESVSQLSTCESIRDKNISASGGLCPLASLPGALPLDPTGGLPPEHHYRPALRTCRSCLPHILLPGDAPACEITLQSLYSAIRDALNHICC